MTRAAVLTAVGAPLEIWNVELDQPRGREVLVEIKAVGLCHSDLNFIESDFGLGLPAVLGHEVAGIVIAVGEDVTQFAEGDHVVGCLVASCHDCDRCNSGRAAQCRNLADARRPENLPSRISAEGHPVRQMFGLGGFADGGLIDERNLSKVDSRIPFDRACLLGCSIVTGVGSITRSAAITPGSSVAVIGCGGVGLNALQGAALAGAGEMIAIDLSDEKLELARSFGATAVINAATEDPVARVREITRGGVEYSFDFTGNARAVAQSVEMLGKGGAAYLVGIQNPGSTLTIDAYTELFQNQKSVHGVYMGSTDHQVDVPRFAQEYLEGRLNLDDLIGARLPIERINEGFDMLKLGIVGRVVVTFD